MAGPALVEVFRFEGFRFERAEGRLLRENGSGVAEPVTLGSRAAALLELLLDRQGKLLTKDEIFAAVWPGMAVEEANLTVQISALRRVLDRDREEGSWIQTVPRRGYRFVAPVSWTVHPTPLTKNDVAEPVAGHPEAAGKAANGSEQIGDETGGAPRRDRHRLRRIVLATIGGGLCLAAAATVAMSWRSISPWEDRSPPRLSIVVLPFANLSDDPGQQYFADGVTEDITADLSRIAHMLVISRSTAFTYKDKVVNGRQIGRELGVRYVLEGSVRRSGASVGVNAQLIDAGTDAHLWGDRFDRDGGDVFALQNEITDRIAHALDVELAAVEASRSIDHPDALDYILRGRAAWRKWPVQDTSAEAIEQFERALAVDPQSVEGLTWLGEVLATRVLRQRIDTADADIARAEQLVETALAASPRSAHAHYAKGQVLGAQGRWAEAIPEFETVIASDRNFASAYASLGWCKFLTGSIDEVIPLQEQRLRFGPHDNFAGTVYVRIGLVHLLQSHAEQAIVALEKARSINPNLFFLHARLAAAYGLKGETEHAAAELAEARRRSSDDRYSSIAKQKATEGVGDVKFRELPPKIRELFEKTYFVGLRKAGMPEE